MELIVVDPLVKSIAYGVAMRLQVIIDKANVQDTIEATKVIAALQPEVNRLMLIANN
jgi:hypothetical protein